MTREGPGFPSTLTSVNLASARAWHEDQVSFSVQNGSWWACAGSNFMGHFLFVVLHIVAILFGAMWLIITIPLHLIYGAVAGRTALADVVDPNAPTPETHVRCPDCRELVRADATKCKHCGSALTPVDMTPVIAARKAQEASTFKALAITTAIVALIAVVLWMYSHR